MSLPNDVYAPVAQKLRRDRLSDFTLALGIAEGQSLESFLLSYSKKSGMTLRTLGEYWKVVSENNKGPIYEKGGIITVRKMFKRWMK